MQIIDRCTGSFSLTLQIASIAFSLAFTSPLSAQTGTATTYGRGCPTASSSCPSANSPAPRSAFGTQNSLHFAIEVPTQSKAMRVLGFELYTGSRTTTPAVITTYLFLADASGNPLSTPIATGSMTIKQGLGWYKTVFASPVAVPAGARLYIAYEGASGRMYFPIVATGSYVTH